MFPKTSVGESWVPCRCQPVFSAVARGEGEGEGEGEMAPGQGGISMATLAPCVIIRASVSARGGPGHPKRAWAKRRAEPFVCDCRIGTKEKRKRGIEKFENRETVSSGHGMSRHGMIEGGLVVVDWRTNTSLPAS